jgi:hypothetical protein
MEQNHTPFAPEAATDEPASLSIHFATPAEETAWRAGVQAGLRRACIAAEAAEAADPLAFASIPVRCRIDGITPEKQREYVEALADTGVGRVAAARIGVSEQSIARLRRRADAGSFSLACAAARRIGARQLHATAWERAIEGTIKGHHYHGELKSEERVYDNRLLIYLLGKTEHLLDEPAEARAVADNWEPFVAAMEQGLPPPDLRTPWERERDEMQAAADAAAEEEDEEDDEEDDEDGFGPGELWEEEGGWLTSFPPPAGFDGVEDGMPGDEDYRRTLSGAEEAALAAEDEEEEKACAARIVRQAARRDRRFGFAGGVSEELAEEVGIFLPMEAEPSEPFEPSGGPSGAGGAADAQ